MSDTQYRLVEINKDLVEHIASALEQFTADADYAITNGEVVLALQYVAACTQRIALEPNELN